MKAQSPIITLVDQILATIRKNPSADTSTFEQQIDKIVYELYRLIPEEIAIVEGVGKKLYINFVTLRRVDYDSRKEKIKFSRCSRRIEDIF